MTTRILVALYFFCRSIGSKPINSWALGAILSVCLLAHTNLALADATFSGTISIPSSAINCAISPNPATIGYTYNIDGFNYASSKVLDPPQNGSFDYSYNFTVFVPTNSVLNWVTITPPPGACFTYSPVNRPYNNPPASTPNADFSLVPKGPFSLTITVVDQNGNAVPGVTLDGLGQTAVTNGSGVFATGECCGSQFDITPHLSCKTFSPSHKITPGLGANWSFTFTATHVSETVSGKITNSDGNGVAGVQINGFPNPVTTLNDGTYSTTVPCGWSGVITPQPSSAQETFDPEFIELTDVESNKTNQNFTRLFNPIISGRVTSASGGISGIGVLRESVGESCPSATYFTDANGNYSFIVPSNWSGTVTCRPSGQWKTPSPEAWDAFTSVTNNQTLDFVLHGVSTWSDAPQNAGIPIDVESCDLDLDTSPTFPERSKTLASAPDGSGGTFVAFYAVRSNPDSKRIYLQRVDATGNILWDGRGLYLGAAGSSDCGQPIIVEDGAGGAIVVWTTPDPERFIRAQRVSGSGELLWATNYEINEAVRYDALALHTLDAVTDGQGGVIIAWVSTYSSRIRLTRITAYGACGWENWGYCPYKEMCYPTYSPCYVPSIYSCPEGEGVQLVSDNAHGAIIVWKDGFHNDDQLFAKRIDQDGIEVTWPSASHCFRIIDDEANSRQFGSACSDGGNGVIIMWQDIPSGALRAQKIDGAGNKPWGANGVTVSNQSYGPDIASDGTGGAYIAWRNTSNVLAQRLQANTGLPVWASNAVVCSDPAGHKDVKVTKASDQAAIISWADLRSGDWDVFAEKLSASGNPLWSSSGTGLQITDGPNAETRQQVVPDANGGGVFVWRREEGEKQHLFAMRRASDFQPPIITNSQAYTDSIPGQGVNANYFWFQHKAKVSWTTNVPATTRVEYRKVGEISWQSTIEDATLRTAHYVTVRPDPDGLDAGSAYELRPISRVDNWSTVGSTNTATTKSTFTEITGFSFQQDVINDGTPRVLVTCGFNTGITSSCGVQIRKHQATPLKFGTAAIDDPTADPHGTTHSHEFTQFYPWNSQTTTPLAFATQYDMVITVWPGHHYPEDPSSPNCQFPDGHNGYTLTKVYFTFTTPTRGGGGSHYEFTIAGENEAMISENALFSNNPNPFAASTGIRFAVKEDSKVRLDIFDLQGRIVRTLANEPMGRGFHELFWDRRSANGERVNSGIYFYRLVIGEFIDTKKMVVLR